jgi:hypothetical protein
MQAREVMNHICLALRRIATSPKERVRGRAAGI